MSSLTLYRTLALVIALLTTHVATAQTVSIGVLNQHHDHQEDAFWSQTAQYLSKTLPGYNFTIKLMGLECLNQAIEKQQLAFVITNPAHIVALQKTEDVRPIATLQTRYQNQVSSYLGAVLIARADRSKLKRLSDLKNQSVMAVSPAEFDGYQIIQRELLLAGLSPEKDFFEMLFTNGSQKNIVKAILNGEADIGIIRSGVLESMIAHKELKPGKIKIIHPQTAPHYLPLHSSSMLYPNWSVVKLNHTEIALARQVAITLKNMPKHSSNLSFDAHYGWTQPADLDTVNGLLQALKLPPYEPSKEASLTQILQEHESVALLILTFILVLTVFTIRLSHVNRKLAASQSELAKHRDNLEQQVIERTKELSSVNRALEQDIQAREAIEETLRRSRSALQGFYEITVNPELSQHEKLTELIKLARNHFGMDAAFLYKIPPSELGADQQHFALCVADGDSSMEADFLANVPIQFDKNESGEIKCVKNERDNKCYISLYVMVENTPHCLLAFVGNSKLNPNIAQVDQELLRLLSQWIGASIERQTIEDEREKYRSQLGKVTRLFTVGEIASGLAHEINQPLTASINYISGSLRRLEETSDTHIKTGLQRSLDSLNQATQIIRRMRDFVQMGIHREDTFDLVPLIKRVLDLLETEYGQQTISLKSAGTDHPVFVIGDPVQIEQVILNLARNAIEATLLQAATAKEVVVSLKSIDDQVEISVSDNGPGIDDNELEHIFDAFHSTKTDGMGLGLAICRSIIETHNSRLDARNTDKGAEFLFRLPHVSTPAPSTTRQRKT
ncbi:MAG: PhnD/SsuA/transferrin family substrate-binding protein [Hydrogenovibrio sp.]|nr:PhnD/SsuA/transferrin family substrate-binding protein [Hydrogenovibrio sp.]